MFPGQSQNSSSFQELFKMKGINSMLILIHLTFLNLYFSKSRTEEYVVLEKSHDVKAW